MPTIPSTYRVEHTWRYRPRNRFSYVPEHANLTLKRARELVARDRHFEREGMRQRIVSNRTGRTVLYSRSRIMSAAKRDALSRIRGY